MVSQVAAAPVPTVVVTAISVPAVVTVSVPVAALDLNDHIVIGRERRHPQPLRSGANESQRQQRSDHRHPLKISPRLFPPDARLRQSQNKPPFNWFRARVFSRAPI